MHSLFLSYNEECRITKNDDFKSMIRKQYFETRNESVYEGN